MNAGGGGRRAALLGIGAAVLGLAVALAGCGGMEVAPTSSETASVAAMTQGPVSTPASSVNPTPRPTVSPRPTETPLAYLPMNADDFKEVVTGSLNFTCPDVDGTDELMWTCSYRDEVTISVFGPSPASVSAMRLVTRASREVDRRSWMRGYASIISVAVWSWVDDNFGSNETATVGGVWVQTTHDPDSDGFLISTKQIGP
jgi:hypothetical protein